MFIVKDNFFFVPENTSNTIKLHTYIYVYSLFSIATGDVQSG